MIFTLSRDNHNYLIISYLILRILLFYNSNRYSIFEILTFTFHSQKEFVHSNFIL